MHTIPVILALTLALCATSHSESQHPGSGFSFSQCELPSLMDINVHKKFKKHLEEELYLMTNVHESFNKSFTLLHDEQSNIYLILNKGGETVFEGYMDGVIRYVASVDIDGDNDQDVVVDLAAYGNHGNGTESFEVLLNQKRQLTRLKNAIRFEFHHGQENKAGVLTWHSSSRFFAVFIGEELDISGSGTDDDPRQVEIRSVKEMWGHQDGRLSLISKWSTPIRAQEVKYLTFR